MTAQAAQVKQPTLLGRAARMLLVFLLVFGMSFRVEMALAADLPTSDLKSYKVDEDTLTDLAVCKVDTEKNEVLVEKGKVRSLSDMVDDKNKDGLTLEFGKSVTLAAAPKWKADGDDKAEFEAAAAKYVEWQVGEEKSTKPTVKIENDGTHGDSVTVTCAVSADAKDYLSKKLTEAKATKVSFTIKMAPKPAEPIRSIGQPKCVILLDGQPEGASDLVLTLDQGKSGYAFKAKVTGEIITSDANTGDVLSKEDFSYSSDSGKSLSDASDGLLGALTWELLPSGDYPLDDSIAKIDQDGRLTVEKDGAFLVQCKVTDAKGDPVVFPQVSVKCGDPKESGDSAEPSESTSSSESSEKKADQGDENPQNSLHVTGRIATAAMAAGVNAADEASEPANASETTEPEESEEGGSSTSSETSEPSSSSSAEDDVTELDKTFSLADIEALDSTKGDFSVNSKAAGDITVTGEGPTLEALFKSMGIENLEGINELKFVNGEKEEVTVGWNALSGAILAVKSYVHDPVSASTQADASESAGQDAEETEGDGNEEDAAGGNTADTSEGKAELLENTRFRVLSNGLAAAGIDADALRWVNEIVVNPGSQVAPEPAPEPEPEPEPEPVAPFTVSVAYAPSPIGQEAVFWPIPSKEIAGATFDYTWEESPDGTTWTQVSENPTYRTVTTEERIGHLFRVILSSNMKDEATGKDLKATSEPVEMKEGSGFSLIYDPPLAGGVAMFEVKLNGKIDDLDINKLQYVWELSTDGCETWTELADQYQGKSTLSIQTDPIDENSENSGSDVTPVYIRARVIEKTGEKRAFIAGPQMLTVRTGEEAGDGDDKKSSAPEGAKPVNTVIDQPGQQQASGGDKATTDDEDDLEFIDDTDFGDDDGDDDDTRAPSEGGTETDDATAAPQLHINGEVTEKILEQEKAVQEQIEQTVPGARWTAINTTEASGDDVRNVLADNPFAPFAIPVGLGITVAGGLEKLLAFRRQL